MIVISDTSPISSLIQIDHLHILFELYGEVIIPIDVYAEVIRLQEFGQSLDKFLEAFITRKIRRHEVFDPLDELEGLLSFLDQGESKAILLAKELQADWLLIDERLGQKAASERGIRTIGLLGVLRKAKQQGLIPVIRPLLDRLRNEVGFWFSDKLYQEVLQSVGE